MPKMSPGIAVISVANWFRIFLKSPKDVHPILSFVFASPEILQRCFIKGVGQVTGAEKQTFYRFLGKLVWVEFVYRL